MDNQKYAEELMHAMAEEPVVSEARFRCMFDGSTDDEVTITYDLSGISEANGFEPDDIRVIKALRTYDTHVIHDVTMSACVWRIG